MPLIGDDALLDRFVELLRISTHVDIAVAWAGPGLAVEYLVEHAHRARMRIAVGLSGNATEPATLRRLMGVENIELRVAPAPQGGMFHTKFYCFRGSKHPVCWVGSANFTRGGFGGNTELVHEFSDRKDVGGNWFDALWHGLDEDPEPAVAHYEDHYTPPKPGRYRGSGRERPSPLPRLQDVKTWSDFVAGLRALDDYCHRRQFGWDVLGKRTVTCTPLVSDGKSPGVGTGTVSHAETATSCVVWGIWTIPAHGAFSETWGVPERRSVRLRLLETLRFAIVFWNRFVLW